MTLRHRALQASAGVGAPIGDGESRRVPITDDMDGIKFEVKRMIDYVRYYSADPMVVDYASMIAHACPAKDKECLTAALFQWVKANSLFVNDPVDVEKLKSARRFIKDLQTPKDVLAYILAPILGKKIPRTTLRVLNPVVVRNPFRDKSWVPDPKMVGDCDEAASFLATLLAAVGIVPRFRFGGVPVVEKGERLCGWHHVWVQAEVARGKWVDLDPTEEVSTYGWFFPGFKCTEEINIYREPIPI